MKQAWSWESTDDEKAIAEVFYQSDGIAVAADAILDHLREFEEERQRRRWGRSAVAAGIEREARAILCLVNQIQAL